MEVMYICEKKGLVEKTRGYVGDNTTLHKGWRKAKPAQEKRDENGRQAVQILARLLNCNVDETWNLVKLDFSDASYERYFTGLTADEILLAAKKLAARYIAKLKQKVKGLDRELKAFTVASDMDGETGEMVRPHIHLILSDVGEQLIRECWAYGQCTDVRKVWRQRDHTPLAAYLLAQVRDIPNMKSWTTTRNLDKPKVVKRVIEDPESEIRVQPGAVVLDRTEYKAGTVSQYVRYIRRPKKRSAAVTRSIWGQTAMAQVSRQ